MSQEQCFGMLAGVNFFFFVLGGLGCLAGIGLLYSWVVYLRQEWRGIK